MNQWISIDDRFPEFHEDVLIATFDRDRYNEVVRGIMVAARCEEGVWRINNDTYFPDMRSDSDVTHWMPLPELPDIAEGK